MQINCGSWGKKLRNFIAPERIIPRMNKFVFARQLSGKHRRETYSL